MINWSRNTFEDSLIKGSLHAYFQRGKNMKRYVDGWMDGCFCYTAVMKNAESYKKD